MSVNQSESEGIANLREAINVIDKDLVQLLAKRRSFSAEIISQKVLENSSLRDTRREEEILHARISEAKAAGVDPHLITRVFHEIIEDSIRLQYQSLQSNEVESDEVRVSYHGIPGSFCEIAAKNFFANRQELNLHGFSSFYDVVNALKEGKCTYAALPVENTTAGGINEVFDLLIHNELFIIGEAKLRVEHILGMVEGSQLASLKKIYCSRLTYGDCSEFLSKLPNIQIEHLADSASCAKLVAASSDKTIGAIASAESLRLYGLTEVKRSINNFSDTFIRYVIAATAPQKVDARIPAKTSIVLALPNNAGALADALTVFKQHGINLTKLENRPIPGKVWEELFYLDFEGNIAIPEVNNLIQELRRETKYLRVLGSYPTSDLSRTAVSFSRESQQASTKEVPPLKIVEVLAKGKKKSYPLASRDHKASDTIIDIGGVKIGGNTFTVIAGPCSVESREQILLCAKHAKESGATLLRGGCFKPRTSPYSFQGLGLQGLEYLAEAGSLYGLPIVTEVMSTEDVEPVAKLSHVLQIGARNMQNFTLLKSVGKTMRPVLLKRGMSSSIEDLLNAAEYILAHGNQEVILCERGIRTFETATRSTLDLSAVPVVQCESHLPIIVDPSHAAGERWLVPALSRGAKAVGAHGIIIEFHPEPEKALSDGPQALRFEQLSALLKELV
jgi:chorismate mutase/prephenate dehydratase